MNPAALQPAIAAEDPPAGAQPARETLPEALADLTARAAAVSGPSGPAGKPQQDAVWENAGQAPSAGDATALPAESGPIPALGKADGRELTSRIAAKRAPPAPRSPLSFGLQRLFKLTLAVAVGLGYFLSFTADRAAVRRELERAALLESGIKILPELKDPEKKWGAMGPYFAFATFVSVINDPFKDDKAYWSAHHPEVLEKTTENTAYETAFTFLFFSDQPRSPEQIQESYASYFRHMRPGRARPGPAEWPISPERFRHLAEAYNFYLEVKKDPSRWAHPQSVYKEYFDAVLAAKGPADPALRARMRAKAFDFIDSGPLKRAQSRFGFRDRLAWPLALAASVYWLMRRPRRKAPVKAPPPEEPKSAPPAEESPAVTHLSPALPELPGVVKDPGIDLSQLLSGLVDASAFDQIVQVAQSFGPDENEARLEALAGLLEPARWKSLSPGLQAEYLAQIARTMRRFGDAAMVEKYLMPLTERDEFDLSFAEGQTWYGRYTGIPQFFRALRSPIYDEAPPAAEAPPESGRSLRL